MPHIHILDLAENGVIKPHVDSSRVSQLYEANIVCQSVKIV